MSSLTLSSVPQDVAKLVYKISELMPANTIGPATPVTVEIQWADTNTRLNQYQIVNTKFFFSVVETIPSTAKTLCDVVDVILPLLKHIGAKGVYVNYTTTLGRDWGSIVYAFHIAGRSLYLRGDLRPDTNGSNIDQIRMTVAYGDATCDIDENDIANSLKNAIRKIMIKEDARLSKDISTKMKRKFEILDILGKI